MVTPAAKREAVAHVRSAFDLSERRACKMIGCERMTMRYRSRRPEDTELRERLKVLAHERRRFGYRRLLVLLRREGFVVNHQRLFRIYREERLVVRRRGGRPSPPRRTPPKPAPSTPNTPEAHSCAPGPSPRSRSDLWRFAMMMLVHTRNVDR